MKKIILIIAFVHCIFMNAQQKLNFGYDNAGNQISRVLCLNGCNSKPSKPAKEIENLDENDMEKFYSGDVISYYPNPVKEQLYIKWEVNDNVAVSSIVVYGITGQTIDKISNTENVTSQNISFEKYPVGVYLVVLYYTNKDQKSIKIIKQ
ncbi:T9SS type A sorting domain-containing protein [Flavobacterium procerum]|uniref:T9SS type A sorting domain-containing protein n=1 Tax=Flavobacterium procerum TaxID=1455569 RepID=A0ABV6BQN0_9FLAO